MDITSGSPLRKLGFIGPYTQQKQPAGWQMHPQDMSHPLPDPSFNNGTPLSISLSWASTLESFLGEPAPPHCPHSSGSTGGLHHTLYCGHTHSAQLSRFRTQLEKGMGLGR